MAEFIEILRDYLASAAKVAAETAPAVWEISATAVRLASIVRLALGGLLTLTAIASWIIEIMLIHGANYADTAHGRPAIDAMLTVLFGFLTIGLSIGSICYWCNSYLDILGTINGKLLIVYRIAGKCGLFK